MGPRPKPTKASKSNTETVAEDVTPAAEEIDDSDSETEFVKFSQLESLIKKQNKILENNIRGAFKTEVESLKAEIIKLQTDNESLRKENDNVKKQAEINKKSYEPLKEDFVHLKTKIAKCEEENKRIVDYCEERTNRQLRKTLVFKNIPEKAVTSESGRSQEESWDDTAVILAKTIADICGEGTTVEQAKNMVERCHRSRPSRNYQGTGPKPIVAAFLDWRDSEWIKEKFRDNNMHTDSIISCDQKYGPLTTVRRNMALKERKRLKANNQIMNGYVKFPAVLMVKDNNTPGSKYKQLKDFSKEPVHFNR